MVYQQGRAAVDVFLGDENTTSKQEKETEVQREKRGEFQKLKRALVKWLY